MMTNIKSNMQKFNSSGSTEYTLFAC